jgi:hypothetical protein
MMANEFFGNEFLGLADPFGIQHTSIAQKLAAAVIAAVPAAVLAAPVNMAQAQVATNANQGTMPSNSYGFTTGIPNPTAQGTMPSNSYGFTTGIPNPTAPPSTTHNPAYDASGNYVGINDQTPPPAPAALANAQATVAGGVNAAQGNTGGATAAPAAQGKGGISPLLLIGGAAVAGIVIFMAVSKKKEVNNVK